MGIRNYIWDEAWELNVSRGKVRGAFHVIKFGNNTDVDGSMETIWDAGDLYTYLTDAATVTVTSNSANDAVGGTGARTVVVEGVDANYNLVSENINLGATSTAEFLRVFRAYVNQAGSFDTNEGTITIASGVTTLAQIRTVGSPTSRGLGQTFMALYTVPAGHTGFIYQWDISTAKADGDVYLMRREHNNGAWTTADTAHTNTNDIERTYKFPIKFEEKTDIEVRAYSPTNNMKIASTFCILLVQNDS